MTLDKVDLSKNTKLASDIKKLAGMDGVEAITVLVADFSGSMEELYMNGTVQNTCTRILPIALAFDDNAEMDFYLFNTTFQRLQEPITKSNFNTYITDKIIGRYKMGSTKYAPIINEIVRHYIGADDVTLEGTVGKAKNKVKGWFGGKVEVTPPYPKLRKLELPIYVVFLTDGDNDEDDKDVAREAVLNASKYGIFFQFIGIGGAKFKFLQQLDTMEGRVVDNANFFSVNDLNQISDQDLYTNIMKEFPSWLVLARKEGLIQ